MEYEVTIGIPVYNVARHIRMMLDSAMTQTFPSIEFLICDDCGTDGSIDIVREYQQTHPRGKNIRILHQPHNMGIGEARNRMMDEAKGRYFYSLDADDSIEPVTIELLYNTAQEHQAEIVYGSYYRVYMFDSYEKDGEKIQIACIPGFERGFYRAKYPGLAKEEENAVFTEAVEDIIKGLKAQCDPDATTILVSHFTIAGCNMESGQTAAFFAQFDPIVYPATLQAADYDLVCFGHIHRPQQVEGSRNTFYCGALTQLNFNDENQERGYWLHSIDGTEVKSDFHKLNGREFYTIRMYDNAVADFIADPTSIPEPILETAKDKIIRVLYDCTDEHNKAFNHALLENWLYETGGAFWVQEITPQKISITVDRKSMDAENTPKDNLREWLLDNGHTPEDVVEAAVKHNIRLVGLSALMTTTVASMAD